MKEGTLAFWPKISVKRYQDLITTFGSVDTALIALPKELEKLPWKSETIFDFLSWKKSAPQTSSIILEQFERENISFVCYGDIEYPLLLKYLTDPPFVLFIRGQLALHKKSLAVVGSRQASEYGINATKKLIPEVAGAGVSIISGLARGIDSAAHEATLKVSGHTVAVLGFGIAQADLKHSKEKEKLAEKIINSGGAVVSEYLPGIPGNNFTFPLRNRIIAGLSNATLVVEARAGSGALITATCTQEDLGRDVMVVPQPIFSLTGIGANNQLKQGAHPVTEPRDILEILKITVKPSPPKPTSNYTPFETSILASLQIEPKDRDSLTRELRIPAAKLGIFLTNLELGGAIILKNTQYYSLL